MRIRGTFSARKRACRLTSTPRTTSSMIRSNANVSRASSNAASAKSSALRCRYSAGMRPTSAPAGARSAGKRVRENCFSCRVIPRLVIACRSARCRGSVKAITRTCCRAIRSPSANRCRTPKPCGSSTASRPRRSQGQATTVTSGRTIRWSAAKCARRWRSKCVTACCACSCHRSRHSRITWNCSRRWKPAPARSTCRFTSKVIHRPTTHACARSR